MSLLADTAHLHFPFLSLPIASGEGFSSGCDESKIKVIITKMYLHSRQWRGGGNGEEPCAGAYRAVLTMWLSYDRHLGWYVLTKYKILGRNTDILFPCKGKTTSAVLL